MYLTFEGLHETEEDEDPREPPIPSPYPSPKFGAALIRPLIDEVYATEVYMWHVLLQEGTDLYLEVAGEDQIGSFPEWWDEEISEMGVDYLLGIDTSYSDPGPRALNWSIRHGIAPEQPFLVVVTEPRWYQCGTYEYPHEYDWENETYVAKVLSPGLTPHQYEGIVADIFHERKIAAQKHEDLLRARWSDVERMYLERDSYYPHKYIDAQLTPPVGQIMRLMTTRVSLDKHERGRVHLLEGRDPWSREKALQDLLTRAVAQGLDPRLIEGLSTRR